LRNNPLFAGITHIREMVLHAVLDTATPWLNICTILFDVRSTSLGYSRRLYRGTLAGQRKIFETGFDARQMALKPSMSCTLSL
jgi:hypothetical protein